MSLLNETRVLYCGTSGKLFSYNVDTRVNAEVDVGKKVRFCASFTGVDCGVRAVLQCSDRITYPLNTDNTASKVGGRQYFYLTTVFPSSTHPGDLGKAAFKYENYLVLGGKRMEFGEPFLFEDCYSVVRVYRDVFLLYDRNTRSWVLSRIVVP